MPSISNSSFLYRFMSDPGYRIWRHILLILVLAAISFHQVFLTLPYDLEMLGNWSYLFGLILLATYLVIGYSNIYILVPQFLLKRKYISYILSLSALIILLLLVIMGIEYFSHSIWGIEQRRSSYFNIITALDNLSYFVLYIICIAGGSITILIRQWVDDQMRIGLLENAKIRSEVNQLKDQINPQFLSNILVRTSEIAETEPQKASEMLFKLSQLLRYGLYDCNREKVLLSSEIGFLSNYLKLEELYKDNLDYAISSSGDTKMVFVPPLLFMPLVRNILENSSDKHLRLNIAIEVNDNNVNFQYKGDTGSFNSSEIEKRLDLLYKDNYRLSISQTGIILQLNIAGNV